jgi:hypothetical protein
MERIGNLSSIVTLISFVIYLIGKVIKIRLSKKLRFESIDVYYNSNDLPSNIKIVEEYNIGDFNSEKLVISSEAPINWIKIYKCEYDEIGNKLKREELIEKHGFLNAGHSIQINTYLSCGIPSCSIIIQRYDYMIGSFHMGENGENGIVDKQIEMSHTFLSYLYYIFE